MAKENNEGLSFTKTDIIKLAQSDPKLAEQIYADSKAKPAQEAFAKFTNQLGKVPENGHTRMYDYVLFDDLRQTVNNAMKGTGLTWHQETKPGKVVTIPQLDNYGKPAFQLNYNKVAYTTGYDNYKKNHYAPLLDRNGQEVPVYTRGKVVNVDTSITYKNGYQVAHDSTSVVAQSTSPQDIGAASTYAKRYSLSMVIGISSGTDNDGKQSNQTPSAFTRSSSNRGSGNFSQAPASRTVSSSQVKVLTNLTNQIAKKFSMNANNITKYVSQTNNGDGQSLNTIPVTNFTRAKNYLEGHLGNK